MTHNTKKLEEIVETLLEELSYGGRKNYLDDTMGMDTAREILRTTLHHQLQKAREEEREKIARLLTVEIDKSKMLEGWEKYWKKIGNRYGEWCGECENYWRIEAAINHSELDQDNK